MDCPLAECQIDDYGVFKYIQIEVTNKDNKEDKKILIRGTVEFDYHKQIFRNFINNLFENFPQLYKKYNFECIGGGRIDKENGHVKVYGYSTAYGQCDHKKTTEILKRYLPDNTKIEFTYSGY